ncbi:MAG TPA: molybdenum cofactor biosynthesis protein MoaE [Dehalococcoidia bacterium]|nr:molybdenum cofactor biosynthesis protein MoaE [Dehalococcoidia bacterium]
MLCQISREPLDLQPIVQQVRRDECGAVAIFLGVVRNESRGRRVIHLEYDAYPAMAERVLARIAQEAASRWPVADMALCHRIGRLEIGETSLVVAVSSPHREEALAACHYAVERIKAILPVWKKEVWEGGAEWIEGSLTMPEEA